MKSNPFKHLMVLILVFVAAAVGLAADRAPITQGKIIARILGPNVPTRDTVIPPRPEEITNFFVTLKVVDVVCGFAQELRGKTLKLPTCEFRSEYLGQTLPLLVSYSPGRYAGSDYWLICTSLEIAKTFAGPK
jgi:hypothetical protein